MNQHPARRPWWRHEAVIAWAVILLPPIGLFLMWKYAPWRLRFKWAWTFLVPLVWLVVVASVFAKAPDDGLTTVAQPGAATTVQAPTDSPKAAVTTPDNPAAAPTPSLPPSPAPPAQAEATSAAAASGPQAALPAIPTATPPTTSGEEEAAESSPPSANSGGSVAAAPPVAPANGRLDVYFFEVSLGDAIYIRTPTGEDVVIDGGDSSGELSAFLSQLGETAIDVVIASHPHADHIGGLPRVLRERQVGSVWTNGQTYTTQLYRDLEAAISTSGATKHASKVGDSFSLGGVQFRILAPQRLGSNLNDNSLVVRMDCGESSFLFTGDAETPSENDMIATRQPLDVDVLKLGHHGSRTSTSSQMMLATTPKLAIYSARPGNQYGHPHKETLDRLAAAGVPTFGTAAAGSTVVVSTACDDQFSVSPKFGSFPTIPAPGAAPQPPAPQPAAPTASVPIVPAAPANTPVLPSVPPAQGNCSPAYPTVCIPPPPPDLDCGEIPFRRFTVLPPDPHGFDGDNDGEGCES